MASVFDLISWIAGFLAPGDNDDDSPTEADVADVATRARGDTVTPAVLANSHDRADHAIVEYLDDDEQPEFVLCGTSLLISDEEGSVAREHPTRQTQVVISDQRVLFVLGGHLSDDIWEVPLADVEEAYVDDTEPMSRYFIVDAERDDAPMTFFADVTVESNTDEVERAASYVSDEAAVSAPRD